MIKRISDGEIIPAWYGCAWRDWASNRMVCLPVPLNVLASYARGAYMWLRFGFMPVPSNPRDAYAQGLRDGRADQ